MKKLMLIITLMFLFVSIGFAQHLKKDGTPDRRYKENKNLPPTAPTKTTVLPTDTNKLDQQKSKKFNTTTTKHLKKDGTPDRRYKENKSSSNNSHEKATGTTKSGSTIYTGPRGGQYHYSKSGKKVYTKRK
jgi:hypothetical protein